jgi:hypothetical protein
VTIRELVERTGWKAVTAEGDFDREASGVYCGDLLSWVMGKGQPDQVWITVQSHMNVIAVASLMEMAAVIIPEGIEMEAPSLEKAKEEGITVLESPLTAYEICARLAAKGLAGK